MKTKKSMGGGLIIYGVLLLIGVAIYLYVSSIYRNEDTTFTNEMLKRNLQEDQVYSVSIRQNSEIPTGTVEVIFIDGSSKIFYKPDRVIN